MRREWTFTQVDLIKKSKEPSLKYDYDNSQLDIHLDKTYKAMIRIQFL